MIHQKQHLKIHDKVLLVKVFQTTEIQLFKYNILRRLFQNKFMNLQLLDLKILKNLLLQKKMFQTEVFKLFQIFLRSRLMISMKTFKDFKQCCGIVMIHSNIFQHFEGLNYAIQSVLQIFTKI
ncbi:hypothetical protein BgiBS90_019089 [Biomphalaria glabrata]|uniref:Uncharacterized protein n=1 Tax=Biomphalaria glabrata TaxID=6526 RepID=A0A2C9L1M6_BIOGL|nr:hypothetical protein BgiBS90_019089 [Biomphalaria glabrata]